MNNTNTTQTQHKHMMIDHLLHIYSAEKKKTMAVYRIRKGRKSVQRLDSETKKKKQEIMRETLRNSQHLFLNKTTTKEKRKTEK